MDRDALTRRLMGTFLGELEERVRALNRDLLALERRPAGEPPAEILTALFRTVHSLKGAARSVNVTPIEGTCHRLEEILAAARDGRLPLGPDLLQLLLAAADAIEESGARLREEQDLPGPRLAALLAELEAWAGRGAGRPRSATGAAPARPDGGPPAVSRRSVRVGSGKLDALLAGAGEMLVARRRLERHGEALAELLELVGRWEAEWRAASKPLARLLDPHAGAAPGRDRAGRAGPVLRGAALAVASTGGRLQDLTRALDRLDTALERDGRQLAQAAARVEEEVRRLRMLPFAEACEGLDRAVLDLARTSGKEVDLVVEGGEVELDRPILEGLKDPLLHLVRNAVDHGIETAAERRAAGKPSRGRIRVTAALRGAGVEVVVEDDGRGLDLSAVREEAHRRGLAAPKDERELAGLVFQPGFSTSPAVTALSGRGMGLDVVESRVESFHGTVDLGFETGRGARFTLGVPLTLTTIRALLVAAGGHTFAFPGTNVLGLVRAGSADLRSVEGREVLPLGGTPVPVASLAGTLGMPAREPERARGKAPIVIVAAGEKRMGFAVDELVAEQEVVVKGLGPRLVRVRNVAGATLLPTGRIALILSAADLVRTALRLAPAPALSGALEKAPPAARKRLLVADDSVTTRALEKSILEAADYEVTVAADGAEAWQLLQERGADLLVADVEMPGMDGLALTEAVRRSKRFRDLPVVLVTALESEAEKARGLEAGADAYLLKSAFDQTQLLETVAQLL